MKIAVLLLSILVSVLSAKTQPIQLPNGGFENWNAVTYDTPANWHIYENGEVIRTTEKNSGTYAVKLVSKFDRIGNVRWASITLGPNTLQPGMPFTKMTDTLTGYYKYISPGSDTGSIYLVVSKNGRVVGGMSASNFQFTPAANYKYFEIPITANDTPDLLFVEFFSSDINGGFHTDGSALFLDDLQLKNSPTALNDVINQEEKFVVYPNPITNTLYIKLIKDTKEVVEVSIYSFIGKLVYSRNFEQSILKTFTVPVSDFATGLYQYRVTIGDVTTTGKFIKE